MAVRLGKVMREGNWSLPNHRIHRLLATRAWFNEVDFTNPGITLTPEQRAEAVRLKELWLDIRAQEVSLVLRQKGVDMRIGLDIASIALKKQAETIILVAGDSDFVPAAKLARREGMEFILDPLWHQVNDDLLEHIDGLQSGLPKPCDQASVNQQSAHDSADQGDE